MGTVIAGDFKTPYDRAWDAFFSRLDKVADERKATGTTDIKPVDLNPDMFLPGSTGINHLQLFAEMKKRGLVGDW